MRKSLLAVLVLSLAVLGGCSARNTEQPEKQEQQGLAGKPSHALRLDYKLSPIPAIAGEAVVLDVNLSGTAHTNSAIIYISSETLDGLLLADDQTDTIALEPDESGTYATQTIRLLPVTNGRFYLQLSVVAKSGKKTIKIPKRIAVQVGPEKVQAMESRGEPVEGISLPAQMN